MFGTESSDLLWFVVGLVLMLAELGLNRFVIVFFGIGAWITAICVALGIANAFIVQLLIFLPSSVVSLLALRKPMIRRFKEAT
jgi:inner membrane protein